MPSKSPEQSAAAFRAEPGEEPLRHRLHTPGEDVPRAAAIVPVQFSAPPFVERARMNFTREVQELRQAGWRETAA